MAISYASEQQVVWILVLCKLLVSEKATQVLNVDETRTTTGDRKVHPVEYAAHISSLGFLEALSVGFTDCNVNVFVVFSS